MNYKIEKEYNKILNTVLLYLGCTQKELIEKKQLNAIRAANFICHIVNSGFPHLVRHCIRKMYISKDTFCANCIVADNQINSNKDQLLEMNIIRTSLGLSKLTDYAVGKPSNSKNLFGFDYTENDLKRQRAAIVQSIAYMRDVCALGHKPVM